MTNVSELARPRREVDILVVGAGFAGLYSLFKARELGYSVAGVEAGSDVGGTWYWNRYPGARCDAESFDYSFSFSDELQQEWDWSERYAAQPEVHRYLRHVAHKFDLRSLIAFDTKVTRALFDESTSRWKVDCDDGSAYDARFCVMATGCLSVPKQPDIDGADSFAGPTYLTSRWPDNGVDFSGLKVAVIGTGSSGIQCIPEIANQAASVTVFQRTPSFSIPARNAPLDPAAVQRRKADYPEYRQRARWTAAGVPIDSPDVGALDVSDDERRRIYEDRWAEGGLLPMLSSFSDLLVDEAANATAADFIRSKIAAIVQDDSTAKALMPTSYPFGAKRACLDTNYYETFNLPNVELVSLRDTPIVRIVAEGIETSDQLRKFDAIVFATGFDAMTGALLRVQIIGRHGMRLSQAWADGPATYLGLAVSGFPNLFTVTGPGSPSVKTNMVTAIEQHVEWIFECLEFMRKRSYASIEANEGDQQGWVEEVRVTANKTLHPLADSWYLGANVPGKPRVFMVYVGGLDAYRRRCDQVASSGYEGFTFTPAFDA